MFKFAFFAISFSSAILCRCPQKSYGENMVLNIDAIDVIETYFINFEIFYVRPCLMFLWETLIRYIVKGGATAATKLSNDATIRSNTPGRGSTPQ